MENPGRGLFFGRKIGFLRRLTEVARRPHGYYFAWAIVYTFWYHPMEATSGHLIRFLLLLQGSSLFHLTRAHVNHGTLVAIMQGDGMWPMSRCPRLGRRFLRDHANARAELVASGTRCGAGAYVAGVLAVYAPLGWGAYSRASRTART